MILSWIREMVDGIEATKRIRAELPDTQVVVFTSFSDREIVLRREEFTLRGKGWISFGQPKATATDVLEFFCE